MRKLVLLITTLYALVSCKYIAPVFDDEVVAEVGKHRLLRSEIKNLIPAGTPPSDSILMLRQYVDSWALKYLIISKAEEELTKEQKGVEKELEEYRNSLIAFRYEKIYIESRLDTVITEQELQNYYLNNASQISLPSSIVKGRVIKISTGSPNLERIRSMYRSELLDEVDELERLCYNSADRYNNFSNQWVGLSSVARELPLDLYGCEVEIRTKNYIETKDSLYSYFAFFSEIIQAGGTPPYEYYLPQIKENIIGKRKQDLTKQLEQELLSNAIRSNSLKTNINDYPKK